MDGAHGMRLWVHLPKAERVLFSMPIATRWHARGGTAVRWPRRMILEGSRLAFYLLVRISSDRQGIASVWARADRVSQ